MHFHVSTSRFTYTGATVIAVDGQFDLASVNSVATPAEESILTRRPILFDLSACTFIDSSAMRFLIQVARLPDVPMAIVVGSSPIRSAFAVLPMNEGVPVFPSFEQGLSWLRDEPAVTGSSIEGGQGEGPVPVRDDSPAGTARGARAGM